MNLSREKLFKITRIAVGAMLIFGLGYLYAIISQTFSISRNEDRSRDIQKIAETLREYKEQEGAYPCAGDGSFEEITNKDCDLQKELSRVQPDYVLPVDPKTNKEYFYLTVRDKALVAAREEKISLYTCMKYGEPWNAFLVDLGEFRRDCLNPNGGWL